MITEDYVSFETTKLLKEKGFDPESITAYYFFIEGYEPILNRIEPQHFVNQCCGNISLVGCPTLQMAMKWLREVHSYYIEIRYSFVGEDECGYVFKIRKIGEDDIGIWSLNDELYGSYEDACEESIKYCLENLI